MAKFPFSFKSLNEPKTLFKSLIKLFFPSTKIEKEKLFMFEWVFACNQDEHYLDKRQNKASRTPDEFDEI